MNKKILLLIAFFFSFVLGYGQVADYSFSQDQGTYVEYGTAPGQQNDNWDDFVTGNIILIGFSFEFNGITYTTCSINSNGYITFGSTLSSSTSYRPISSNTSYAGSISALGTDLDGNRAIGYITTGTAPNRVFTVQWRDAKRFVINGDFDFQIRLNESSNVVQVVYGGSATNSVIDVTAQVGLRGSSNIDYNNRSVVNTNSWSSSARGTSEAANCITGSGTGKLPANGLTFTWTPKPMIISFTPNNSCGTSGVSVVITGRNFTSATTVNFNGVPAVFVVNSSTQITAQLPNTATTGAITVTTPGGTAISAASFTVNTLPTAPKVGAIKQPTCIVPSGSADLTLPIGTWTLNQNGTSIGAVTGTTKTITGLAPGIYKYTVTSASGCISQASADVVIDPLITTKLSSSGWDKGTPTIDKNIVFNAPYSLQKDDKLEACSCEVNSSVTINEGATLKIYNGVKVGTGTLTFENNASLVQENEDPTINTGNIIYKRKSSSIRKSDYIYWSSPVATQALKAVSPNTVSNRFWSFNAADNRWAPENWDNTMVRGKGYIIRGPEFFPTTVPVTDFIVAPFTGVPHNGQFDIAIAGPNKSNLIGNPYPSALDAVSFLQANPVLGTLYFWTHATEIRETTTSSSAGLVDFVYTSDDYATYNLSGSVAATAKGNTQTGVENAANKPSGKIAAGQGFFATGITSGTAIFKNSMRVGVGSITGSNTQFFKTTQSSKSTNAFEKHRVWLNLTNEQGAFKQVLVGYITDATNGYDNAFDGPNNNGNQFVNFYSINEDKNLTIQGRALPFDENDVVPLGYSSVIQGAFSISIDDVDGLLTSETIYLEDKSSNSIHDLKKAAYTFNTEKGTFNDRFVLRYRDRTLGSADFDLKGTSVLIAKDKNELKIKSQTETINQITVFDLLGRKVFDKVAVNSNEFQTSAIKLSNQIVVVKVTLANGTVISKKVIY